ncbi:Maf family protein [Salidesulfovibrio onnuriiensis]|uniref:Maf family protein n=1 Tax=Salidesulfovibrio onnuriiensis TaxID=2583823 RepID=UPI00164F8A0F|nr:Maf family protein [Salidesulfovibrio onnuriiensis]
MNDKKQKIYSTLKPLVLASGSPRRKELLGSVGLEFTVHPSRAEEPKPEQGENPGDYALRMARIKTEDVAGKYPKSVTLGSDTIVVLGSDVMGKPESDADALRMLSALSGQTHQVITGCCLAIPGEATPHCFYVSTDVVMRASSKQELRNYIATGEPADKAGAYAIQGIGSFMVKGISGSYTNVVGLPLARVLEVLASLGVIVPSVDRV